MDNAILKPSVDNTSVVWRGGGIDNCGGTITNNIIWVSRTDLFPEFNRCSKPTYSCIKGWTGGGKGNINSDPQFMNAKFDETRGDHAWPSQDWRLRPDSPCIDEGTTAGMTTDFYGMARGIAWRSNRVHGDNTHTDMGAHEFVPGKLTLWVQRFHEPLFAGGQLRVKWAMQPGAGSAFALKLFKGSAQIADFGQFAAEPGHVDFDTAGGFWVTLPAKMITATDYALLGQIIGSSPTYPSPPFWVMSTSGVRRESWVTYQ